MFIHLDCRHYRGDRPCRFERLCQNCPEYEPMGPRVLIIKLGALGDVVRTACILPSLAALEEPPYVTWLTAPAARPLVERMPGVHRVLTLDAQTLPLLHVEQFDLVISLDKDPVPCAIAMAINADRRVGMGLSRHGTVYPLTAQCDDYFLLGLDNEEKFHVNQRTYPDLIHEALELPNEGKRYELALTEADRAHAAARLAALGAPDKAVWIGINPGAGAIFANKAWREENYVKLIGQLHRHDSRLAFLLLGGPDEAELMERIGRECKGGLPVFAGGASHPLGDFAGLVERCHVLVSGDTLSMHLAIALNRRVVTLFGPTCPQEIEMYGLGEKVISPIDCAPCYLRQCDRLTNCQDAIKVETVCDAVLRQVQIEQAG